MKEVYKKLYKSFGEKGYGERKRKYDTKDVREREGPRRNWSEEKKGYNWRGGGVKHRAKRWLEMTCSKKNKSKRRRRGKRRKRRG